MEDIRKEHVKNIVKHMGKVMRRWIKGARWKEKGTEENRREPR